MAWRHFSFAASTLLCSGFLLVLGGCGANSNSPGKRFQLTVAVPAPGAGTVTSAPQGINCPGTCSAGFAQGTAVTLKANAGSGYFFGGWSGACTGIGSCTIAMNGDESVNAAFAPGETLTVAIAGNGTGTVTSDPAGIDCPTTCSAVFPQDTSVTLSASAGTNDVFSSWSGACSGSSTCSVALGDAESVTANFADGTGGGGDAAAFVYVSSTAAGGNHGQIEAFAADSSGQLTPVAGSPFAVSLFGLTASSKFLFGTDGTSVYSYALGSDGSITPADFIDVRQYNNPQNCNGGPQVLFMDRAGSNLYDLDLLSDCANNTYQSIGVDGSSGALSYLGMTADASPVFERGLSFVGNDQFGFGASCYHSLPEVYGFKRNADGTLSLVTDLGGATPLPSGGIYCPWLAAADGQNDVAVAELPLDESTLQPDGPAQIAVYTVDDSGSVTTSSTAQDMPQVAGNTIYEMTVSPSGRFLAVGESSGLEVFNFNGANPVTPLTGLLTSDQIEEVRWGNANRLYAISNSAGKVYVFTVSTDGTTQVPGSPYSIASPVDIVVIARQ